MLRFVVSGVLIAGSFFSLSSSFAATQGDAVWSASINRKPVEIGEAAGDIGGLALSAEVAAAMQTPGVRAKADAAKIDLSGAEGLEQLRSAVFDDAAEWADFLGGPVELTLALPSGDQPVTVELEARMTTGYRWEVLPPVKGRYASSGESSFDMRHQGMGSPAIQTIELQSTGSGDGLVRLVYRRPFEKDQAIHGRLKVSVAKNTGLIELTDPTPAELMSASPAESGSTAFRNLEPVPESKAALPASYDSRLQGLVTAVRDQGGCGSCWAFGTVSAMEIALRKGGAPLTDLSEQFLISCNKDGWDCGGGLTASKYHYGTLGYSQTVAGAVLESTKPYIAADGTCGSAYPHPYRASGWQFLTGSEWTMPTNDQIKNAILTYGSVTAGVCVDNGWYSYSTGVYRAAINTANNVCGGSTNHQIVLVGWNDATQSWILRNSWGKSWGENGYMRIAYDPAGTSSRVGEGSSWVRYVSAASTTPVPYTPAWLTYTVSPTYAWSRVAAATYYRLRVKDVAAGTYPINGLTVASSFCNTTTNRCSATPGVALVNGKTYEWQIAAGAGAYSSAKSFLLLPGFSSTFNGGSIGWTQIPVGAWANSSLTYYSNGLKTKWSNANYNQNFTNFTYQASMRRLDTDGYSSGLRIRGSNAFDANNNQLNDYTFLYAVSGTTGGFSVWKHVAGTETALKGWTTTTAVKANAWNKLQITTWGSLLRFYINDVLVWSGTDTSLTTGRVGLTKFDDDTPTRLDVDWAKLGMSDVFSRAVSHTADRADTGQAPVPGGGAAPAQSARMPGF